ncbi:M50 family metallopeptidase [Candidatus Venteria ishoeyi]|uniref:Uncharacterized protein n=1 Tax=Candidatus Venteria ishoeyi TaxID=1899563 RepID=A0A1H6F7N6_9GAMM|nr:M50 family metallopeptidase [Candidatus Venteria ishoeyi]MDM8545807.1 M50 family metallopeptidase [Candidatus Venteria ishoeyi]SEH04965.1 Uncharacterised protein [Candidatus Venteria ishoeyi]
MDITPQADSHTHSRRAALYTLLIAAIVTVVIWQFPWGNYVLYPFTILATWFHEMGHGLSAQLLGGNFERLTLYADGSGVARYTTTVDFSGFKKGIIAAAGPLGPAIAGAIFIIAGRNYRSGQICLWLLLLILVLSAFLWIRSGFGLSATLLLAGSLFLILWLTPHWMQQFTIQFLGVQAIISAWRQLDYLFTYSVTIADQAPMLSDTGQMAKYLFLPYWFWASFLIVIGLALLFGSLRIAYR